MNWSDSPKAARTFNKRNGVERFTFEPTVEDFEDDYSVEDSLIDGLFEQTEEELVIVDEYLTNYYLYPGDDSDDFLSLDHDWREAERIS